MTSSPSPQEMLDKLVSFPTVSHNSNLDLIRFVADYLASHGISSNLVPDSTGEKAALHARIGPDTPGGIVLSAHTDVVPVEGQDWSSDPFQLREQAGKLYGRGSADMKGFAATVLAMVPDMVAAKLTRPVHIALSYDEEVGCLGAPPMIENMLANGPRPSAVIVGEPTNMKVVTGQKGISVLETRITGKSVHSSQLNRGASAVSVAARLISWLDGQTTANRERAGQDCPFDPPFTTLHCGEVAGGTAHNITAAECHFVTDIRTLPEESPLDWQQEYEAFARQGWTLPGGNASDVAEICIKRIALVPSLQPETDGPAEMLARRLTGDNSQNSVVYATEAGQFQEAGLSTVVCGPGSIDQAHQADEFIEIRELEKCRSFLGLMIRELC